MIEIIQTEEITVPVGQSIPFNEVAVKSGCAEHFRRGGAVVSLLKPGRYLVTFSGNIAVPTGETVGEISLALAVDGSAMSGAVMRVTPAAVEQFFNVSTQHYVDVPACCGTVGTANISVLNTSDIPVLVDNANMTAVRVC